MAKFSCGHKADPMLSKAEVLGLKWCVNCEPTLKAKRQQHEAQARQRNERTQRDLNRIGRGGLGPLYEVPDDNPFRNWNPTTEQFMNVVRALAVFGPSLSKQGDES